MNARQSIIISIVVLIVLRAGLTIFANTPPLVWTLTITIPAWLITTGAGLIFLAIILWLRANLFYIAPDVERAGRWLADDSAPLLTDLLDQPAAYTGQTERIERGR
jgi:hypothetical protein